MMPNSQGPGLPLNLEQRIRWQPCQNMTKETVPPFACMAHTSLVTKGSTSIRQVSKPTIQTELRQVASDVVFNGPEPISPEGYGRCTEDYPARCLHLESDTIRFGQLYGTSSPVGVSVPSSRLVGPKANSWLLWDSGNAFRWNAEDTSITFQGYDVGLITPAHSEWSGATFTLGSLAAVIDIPVDANLGLSTVPAYGWAKQTQSRQPFSLYDLDVYGTTPHGITLNVVGIWSWQFFCTLSSATGAQGAVLRIDAYINSEAVARCFRANQLEVDNFGAVIQRSAENVAMQGEAIFAAGDILNFRNKSACPITVSAAYCVMRRVGP